MARVRLNGLGHYLRIACLCAVPLLAGCASLGKSSPTAALERRAVFHPSRYPEGNWRPQQIRPQDVWFTSADGTRLHGWYLPHESPRGVLLLCHGNAGNVTSVAESMAALHERHGLTVMTFDYRGYGRSEGEPSEAGVLQDGRAALAWLAEYESVAPSEIIVMGISLGGAVAVDLAARENVRGLILASTFTSLPDVASSYVPLLPARRLVTMQFNSLEKIKKYRGPVLISHGDADELIPFAQGRKLFDAVQGPRKFVTIAGGRHNDAIPVEYAEVLDAFLRDLPPVASALATSDDADLAAEDTPKVAARAKVERGGRRAAARTSAVRPAVVTSHVPGVAAAAATDID